MESERWKVYVPVRAEFRPDGTMLPRELTWEDGSRYTIARVLEIRQAAAQKSGGQGDRYAVMIRGKRCYLFFERCDRPSGNVVGRWFVERRQ